MNTSLEKVCLENGLTVYFYLDQRKHTTFVDLVTKFGSLTKDFVVDGKVYHLGDGVAHVLEHYIVEENEVGDFTKLLGEKQMSTNASTGLYKTSYYFEAVEDLDEGIKILLKSSSSPIFSEERLRRVKEPIYQEIRMYQDQKFTHFNRIQFDSLFQRVSFRNTGGTIEEVKKISLEEIKACYQAFYQPKNQVLVVAGNFDKEHVYELIKEIYQELPTMSHEVKVIDILEPKKVKRKKSFIALPTTQEFVSVAYKVDLSHLSLKEKLKLDFYLSFFLKMAFGITSSAYQEAVSKKIITSGIQWGLLFFSSFVVITVGGHTDFKDELEKIIKSTIRKMNCFDEELFSLMKKETVTEIIIRKERIGSTILPFIDNLLLFHYPYMDTVEDILEFQFDDFQKMIQELDFSHHTVTVMEKK